MTNNLSSALLSRFWNRLSNFPRIRYERQLKQRGWYDLAARSEDPAIFIGGCGRSGTTLLREILNRHPRIMCGPETSMFGLPFWPAHISDYWDLDERDLRKEVSGAKNLVDFASRFFCDQARRQGKARWADKTPNNVRSIDRILTWFPHGRFIHVIRDGRDVVCSLRHHPKERVKNGKIIPVNSSNPIAICAKRWLADTSKGLVFRSHPRYTEVRYEDLVSAPQNTLENICEFLGENYIPELLSPSDCTNDLTGRLVNNASAGKPISSRSVGRWRCDLNDAERQAFIDIAGELLIVTGYAMNHDWVTEVEGE